jgi:hypothetical protein
VHVIERLFVLYGDILDGGGHGVIIDTMSKTDKLLASIRNNPADVRFSDAVKVAESFFGKPRIAGSHHIFTVPNGTPVNLQDRGRKGESLPSGAVAGGHRLTGLTASSARR